MNIFFGKISQKFDTVQLTEGYYMAPKDSSWFGELQKGDFVYMIGGDKIQFWQAKEWGVKNGKDCMFFDILNADLGINVSQLIALKFLYITKALAVLTSRSARNKAFFKLELIKKIVINDLSDSQFYKNAELYRTIRVIKKADVIKNSEDIQLIYENNKLELVDNNFIESSIKNEFIDNLDKKGKGAIMKDNVLEFFSNAVNDLPTTFTYNQIGLRSFYDTFFCEYKESKKYYLVGAYWDTSNPQDQTSRFVKESIWFNGYEDKFIEEVKNVPIGSEIAIKAAFVRDKSKSVMTIKARGIVTENHGDGRTLDVEWEEDFVAFEVEFGGYMGTIKEVKNQNHIEEIWMNEKDTNYWIFQGSPKIYDAINALNANAIKTWTVSAHKDKINPGDKFILWLTGNNSGCYALGRVESEVSMMKEEDSEMSYYLNPTSQIENTRVKIVIEHKLVDNPVLWEMIKEDEVFKDFKGGNQGTNFTATNKQYEAMLGFVNSNSNNAYTNVKKVLHQRKLQSFLSLLRNYLKEHNIQPKDNRISFNVWEKENRLVFLIGRRYVLNIQKKGGETEFSFTTKNILTDKNGGFTNQKGEIEAYWNIANSIENYISEIEEGFTIELGRNAKCPFRKYTNQDFINDVYQTKQSAMATIQTETRFPLNQILYGPPGTGKTYHTINKSLSIIENKEEEVLKNEDRKEIKKRFDQYVKDGRIVFTTFHQSMSYEDFIEGIKPTVDENEDGEKQVIYDVENGLFKQLVENAKKPNKAITKTQEVYSFDDGWDDLVTEANKQIETKTPLFLSIQSPKLGLQVVDISGGGNLKLKPIYSEQAKEYTVSYSRTKKLQEAFTDLSIIKNIDKEFRAVIGGSNSTAYWSVLNYINKRISHNKKSEIKETVLAALPYVLIIDEINRGNVSQIFGELITLIEEDKRLGKDEAIEVVLPYSNEKFGVPSNLFIIGTMNTADRSVEALDTALRRRFSFKELMPNIEVVDKKGFIDYQRSTIMEEINNRIELLLDRNHTLGHAYFIKPDFKRSFQNEIIPLLQEYFYNDYGKIGLVLGKGFVREKSIAKTNDKSIFADFETKNEVDILKSYELIPFNEVDFDLAIKTLLA
jgi:hypothetical protein